MADHQLHVLPAASHLPKTFCPSCSLAVIVQTIHAIRDLDNRVSIREDVDPSAMGSSFIRGNQHIPAGSLHPSLNCPSLIWISCSFKIFCPSRWSPCVVARDKLLGKRKERRGLDIDRKRALTDAKKGIRYVERYMKNRTSWNPPQT
jgi:hypothetical protein